MPKTFAFLKALDMMEEPEKEKEKEQPKTQADPDRTGSGGSGKTRIGAAGTGGGEWPWSNPLPDSAKPEIIVCSENDLLRRGICAMLSPIAKIVAEVASGDEALPAIRLFQPKLVILDPNIENLSAVTICRESMGVSPSTFFLIFSDKNRITSHLRQFIRAGAIGFCLNSSGIETLYEAFDQVIQGLPFCDPKIKSLVKQMPTNTSPNTNLNDREIEILIRLDMSNGQIAEELDMKVRTVEKCPSDGTRHSSFAAKMIC